MANRKYRTDEVGSHRSTFDKNKRRIYATQTTCGICGHPVDFSLKYPDPLSACIDHIVPVSRNGHPSAMENLQLAHWTCNRQKSDKLINGLDKVAKVEEVISSRNLPHTMDWKNYKAT